MGRLIAIGDIHGQADLLHELLLQVKPTQADRLVFLGDYIDRGLQSPQVIERLLALQQRFPRTVFLRGNHEQMLLDAVAAALRVARGNGLLSRFPALRDQCLPPTIFAYLSCGGRATLAAYQAQANADNPIATLQSLPEDHLSFLRQTRFYYRSENYFFVHAGVDPKHSSGKKQEQQVFLWLREPLWKYDDSWNEVVVHGHTPVPEPYFGRLEINLDTGAGFGDRLTACDVVSRKVWQAVPRSI